MNAPEWLTMLVNMTAQAAVLCAIVFAVTKLFGRWIPANWRAVLWFLVVLRLLIPVAPPSRLSIQNVWVSTRPVVNSPSAPVSKFTIQDLGTPPVESPGVDTETIPTPIIQQPKPVQAWTILAMVWSAGAVISLAILGVRTLVLRRRLRSYETPALLRELLEECRAAVGLRRPLKISVSREIAAPALTGFFSARLIVPERFDQFAPEQIRRILRHELAHIKQGHLVFHWVTLIARCVHWFNPFVHFAAARLRQECELAADAAALGDATEPERIAYGETILQVLAQTTAPSSALALGMAEQARHIEQRLRALTQPNRSGYRILGIVAFAVIGIVGLSGADTAPPVAPQQPKIEEGRRLILEGKPDEAANVLQKAVTANSVQISKNPVSASDALSNARTLIEMGKLAEAEQVLKAILKDSPHNQSALDYLDLIKEQIASRNSRITPRNWSLSSATNGPSPARKIILGKLDSIRFDEFPVEQETQLMDVLKELQMEVRKRDSGGRGVNFIISQSADAGKAPETDVEKFSVRFGLPIRDLTLRQLLDAILMVSKGPPNSAPGVKLAYSVEDYAIVFYARPDEGQLYTRTFKVDPNTFRQALTGAGVPTTGTNLTAQQVASFFSAAGVNFPTNAAAGQTDSPRKAIFLNERTGVLYARAPLADLDAIETTLHKLNVTPPPQIAFSVKIADAAPAAALDLAKKLSANATMKSFATNEYIAPDARVTDQRTNAAAKLQLQSSRWAFDHATGSLISTSTVSPATLVILTKEQANDFEKALKNKEGVDMIGMPSVTTLVNRQARISVEETKTYAAPGRPGTVNSIQAPLGPVVDVIVPRILETGLELHSTVSVTSFLGYADVEPVNGEKTPLPQFRVRSSEVNTLIPEGSSLLIVVDADEKGTERTSVPVLSDIPQIGRLFKKEQLDKTPLKQTFILITPALIDSFGNPVRIAK